MVGGLDHFTSQPFIYVLKRDMQPPKYVRDNGIVGTMEYNR